MAKKYEHVSTGAGFSVESQAAGVKTKTTVINQDGTRPLANGKIEIGDANGKSSKVTPTGDVTITNTGVTAIGAGKVTGAMRLCKKGYDSVSVDTNGTTPVNVFGAGGAPCALTITSIVVIAKDTTAGNIITKQAGNTVATIAKGVTAGVLTGATSLANKVYATSDVCTVESSSAGNATVLITFEVA